MSQLVSPLDNIEHCPVADSCSLCGKERRIRVATYDTLVGVICATVCGDCILARTMPRLSAAAAAHAVLAHYEHVGIDLETAADLRDAERRDLRRAAASPNPRPTPLPEVPR